MEHRCTQRYACDLSILIYQHDFPVAIGRIRNGSRWGIFVEADCTNIDCEHQVSLMLPLSRNSVNKLQRIEMKALIVHKTERGFGAELDISSQEQTDVFVDMLRNLYQKPHEEQSFRMVANR